MSKIKFGTDGWRAIIGQEYTTDNVARVSIAVAEWLNEKFDNPSVVIGHDCRFAGELFAETTARVLASKGILVKLHKGFVSTPMVSLGVVKEKANLGIVITASHNPPSYNGYKLKGDFGGPLLQNDITDIENRIPNENTISYDSISIKDLIAQGKIIFTDLENMYCEHAENNFDLDNRIIFGFDNEFDKAELYNYYTGSAYAESDEAIFSQYFDIQLRPKENTYTTFGLRRDYHTTAEDYYTGRATIAYKPDNNTKLRSNIGTSVRFPALNSYHHGHYLINKESLKAETGKSIDIGLSLIHISEPTRLLSIA